MIRNKTGESLGGLEVKNNLQIQLFSELLEQPFALW